MHDEAKSTKRKRPARLSRVQYMQRIRIENMLIDGWRKGEIVDMMRETDGLSEKRIYALISEVLNKWKSIEADDARTMRAKYVARMERLYKLAMDDKSYGIAVKIQDTINKMVGLYAPEVAQEQRPAVITISGRNSPVSAPALAASSSPEIIDLVETAKPNGTKC